MWGDPLFRSLTLLIGGVAFLTTGVLDLFIFYLKEELGQGDRGVGVVFGVASIGSIIGGVLVSRLRRVWEFGPCFVGGFLVEGAMIAAIGVAPSVLLVVPLAVAFTFAESLRQIPTMTLRQEITPDHMLGRVTAAFWMAFNVPGPIGATALTAFAGRVGAPTALGAAGGIAIPLGLAALLTAARARRPEEAWARRHPELASERATESG